MAYMRTGHLDLEQYGDKERRRLRADFSYYQLPMPAMKQSFQWSAEKIGSGLALSNNNCTVNKSIRNVWKGVIGSLPVDSFSVRLEDRGTLGLLMIGFGKKENFRRSVIPCSFPLSSIIPPPSLATTPTTSSAAGSCMRWTARCGLRRQRCTARSASLSFIPLSLSPSPSLELPLRGAGWQCGDGQLQQTVPHGVVPGGQRQAAGGLQLQRHRGRAGRAVSHRGHV